MHDEWIPGSAEVRVLLAQLERRVPREGPADRIVVVRAGEAEVVDLREDGLRVFADRRDEAHLVVKTIERSLAGRAVVSDEDEDERVLERLRLLEERHQAPYLRVGVLEEARVDLGHSRKEALLVGRKGVPFLHALEHRGELGVLWNDPELLLSFDHDLAVLVPPHVELALVLVAPLLRDVVGRMASSEREMAEPGSVGIDRLLVADEGHRSLGDVFGQVVALVGQARLIDRFAIEVELREPLVRVATEEAVEPIETEDRTARPAVVGAARARLLGRGVVPLSERERHVADLVEDRPDRGLVLGLAAVIARISRREFGDVGHPDRVVVTARQQARSRRGAQRGRVKVDVSKAVVGELRDVGRVDETPERARPSVSDVVENDVEDVGRALGRTRRDGERRLGHVPSPADPAGKGLSLDEGLHRLPRLWMTIAGPPPISSVPGGASTTVLAHGVLRSLTGAERALPMPPPRLTFAGRGPAVQRGLASQVQSVSARNPRESASGSRSAKYPQAGILPVRTRLPSRSRTSPCWS